MSRALDLALDQIQIWIPACTGFDLTFEEQSTEFSFLFRGRLRSKGYFIKNSEPRVLSHL